MSLKERRTTLAISSNNEYNTLIILVVIYQSTQDYLSYLEAILVSKFILAQYTSKAISHLVEYNVTRVNRF